MKLEELVKLLKKEQEQVKEDLNKQNDIEIEDLLSKVENLKNEIAKELKPLFDYEIVKSVGFYVKNDRDKAETFVIEQHCFTFGYGANDINGFSYNRMINRVRENRDQDKKYCIRIINSFISAFTQVKEQLNDKINDTLLRYNEETEKMKGKLK